MLNKLFMFREKMPIDLAQFLPYQLLAFFQHLANFYLINYFSQKSLYIKLVT